MSSGIAFRAEDLLPGQWKHFAKEGPVRAFNPGLLGDGDSWLFAYRIVGPDDLRRIGLCRLDANLSVIAGSQLPFSDLVRFDSAHQLPNVAMQWFADPRLYRLAGRVFIYWNSGWHEPHNHQFLQELDPTTLRPIGGPREFILPRGRQKLEKNWTLFEAPGGELRAVYSVCPHRVLKFRLEGEGPIGFEDFVTTEWHLSRYPASHGGLRGGAPPCLAEGCFWSFCHTVHDGEGGYRYAAAVYCFSSKPSFEPVRQPKASLSLHNPFGEQRTYPALNPAVSEVIYPCGATRDGKRWLVSHGINDEHCAISILDEKDVLSTLEPVSLVR